MRRILAAAILAATATLTALTATHAGGAQPLAGGAGTNVSCCKA